MKALLKDMKSYTRECILAPLFKMLEALFDLFVPLVVKRIIDVAIPGRDTGMILRMCLLLAALALIGMACSFTAQFFSARAATGFAAKIRHNVFAHIQTLSFSELDHIGNATLITRMTSDVNQIQTGVNMTLRLFMRSPFVVFGAMIMAFTIDVRSALIFAVVIPILSAVVFGIILSTKPLYKKVQNLLDRITGRTRENLTGVRVIRAFRQEEKEETVFGLANDDLKRMQLYVGRISAVMNPVTYLIINIAIVVLIYTGAIRVSTGIITQGAVVALVNYMNQILVELIKLANLIVTMTKAVACGNRVQTILETGDEKEAAVLSDEKQETLSSDCEDEVVFDHVTLHYGDAGDESLSDISFTVKKGQTIGVIGGTGSGKSSLVNMIPGFYPASQGKIYIAGHDVSEYPVSVLRGKVGIVMQKAVLFAGTIRDNILFGNPEAADEEIYEALEAAQALEVVQNKDGQLDAQVEQDGRNFSGGQKQRLSIARALVRKPEILILDDSASALDFATDAALRKAISGMNPEMTIFIVSQRAASIMAADQIIVLDDGRVSGIGTHKELLESNEVYQEIYSSQYS